MGGAGRRNQSGDLSALARRSPCLAVLLKRDTAAQQHSFLERSAFDVLFLRLVAFWNGARAIDDPRFAALWAGPTPQENCARRSGGRVGGGQRARGLGVSPARASAPLFSSPHSNGYHRPTPSLSLLQTTTHPLKINMPGVDPTVNHPNLLAKVSTKSVGCSTWARLADWAPPVYSTLPFPRVVRSRLVSTHSLAPTLTLRMLTWWLDCSEYIWIDAEGGLRCKTMVSLSF